MDKKYSLGEIVSFYGITLFDKYAMRGKNFSENKEFYLNLTKKLEGVALCVFPEDTIKEIAKLEVSNETERQARNRLMGLATKKTEKINQSIKNYQGVDMNSEVIKEMKNDWSKYQDIKITQSGLEIFEYAKIHKRMGKYSSSLIISNDPKLHKICRGYSLSSNTPKANFEFLYRIGQDVFEKHSN